MQHQIDTVDPKAMASQLRELAKEVESGGFVAFVFVGCDAEGSGGVCCMVDRNRCEYSLIDAMIHDAKTAMFESYEDGR